MEQLLTVISICGAWWLSGYLAFSFLIGGLRKKYGDAFAWRRERKTNSMTSIIETCTMIMAIVGGGVTLLLVLFTSPKSFLSKPVNLFKTY